MGQRCVAQLAELHTHTYIRVHVYPCIKLNCRFIAFIQQIIQQSRSNTVKSYLYQHTNDIYQLNENKDNAPVQLAKLFIHLYINICIYTIKEIIESHLNQTN